MAFQIVFGLFLAAVVVLIVLTVRWAFARDRRSRLSQPPDELKK